MNSLGFLGSMYMFFLIALLVVALGAGANYLAHGVVSVLDKPDTVPSNTNYTTKFKGGYKIMENNPWLRYALYSFLGILLLMAVVGLLAPNQQSMYGQSYGQSHGRGQMMPGMNTGFAGNGQMPMGNASFNGGMMVPVIMVPVNSMPMGMQYGMPMGQMTMGQMPMGMQSGNMGMQGQMPMGMQSQMPMQGGGMGMMGMPMGMPMGMQGGGGMGNMQGGGGMGMMNMSGGGSGGSMSGGSSGGMSSGSSGGGMGMMSGMM